MVSRSNEKLAAAAMGGDPVTVTADLADAASLLICT